ncbi:MAG: GCN5 family acetyltransferase [Actinobacteria bacterium BACL2 MAG-121001-bin67]|uniref:GCN5 family acetyltransferase n=1 Tax=Actinobacteria bacterium BACL2 MAG-121001-bin67 TaxID=1655572 RepID=A0A0R2P163_9ACTN|nr:MAG: GCN5 family acetyltransferase [Actinobacteria bacterium BACL2 MAG-121001-bin67]MDP4931506.1 GNAT family N-acetyltransferase [Candidatus Nanopelagicaceae bacterium]
MKIRPAKREEVGEVLQLIQDLATYEKAPDQVEASRDDLLNTIFAKEPKVFCDLVEVDGQIAGMAIWFLNYSTWQAKHGIYLEDLYIKPEFRAKGYGKALLKHLAQICDKQGYGRLQWWVLDWNSPAIEFYRSFGAEAMDEWTVYRTSGQALKDLGN